MRSVRRDQRRTGALAVFAVILAGLLLVSLPVGAPARKAAVDQDLSKAAKPATSKKGGTGKNQGKGKKGKGKKSDQSERPNVILITSDDQTLSQFRREYMPRTFSQFVPKATNFADAIVATPLCCPSRAAIQTGQYGHNNGVLHNFYGKLEDRRNVLSTWLRRAGYRTMHVGRFFNGYEGVRRDGRVAPGYDNWRTALLPRQYYDYEITLEDGSTRHFGNSDRAHLTTNLTNIATKMIDRRLPKRKPFFLQLDYLAPHIGPGSRDERCKGAAVPGPADEQLFTDAQVLRTASYDEKDISDKPPFMQSKPPLSDTQINAYDRYWGCALGSVSTLDRGVGEIFKTLHRGGGLKDTAVIFLSDNGYLYGQHRLGIVKAYPYEEVIRVPLLMKIPGQQIARSDIPAANIDVAPTILDLADAEPCKAKSCRVMDGRSLLPTMRGEDDIPADRPLGIELFGLNPRDGLVCAYNGVRTPTDVMIHHSYVRTSEDGDCEPTDQTEHYNRIADPMQLQNLFPAAPGSAESAEETQLRIQIDSLANCTGIEGRDLPTPGRPFCG